MLADAPPRLDAADAEALAAAHGYVGTATRLTGERDANYRLDTPQGAFVLKITREPWAETELQRAALDHLAGRGLPAPTELVTERTAHGTLRILTWLPGEPIWRVPMTGALRRDIGAASARITAALADFDHPSARRVLAWDVQQIGGLAATLPEHPEADAFAPRLARLARAAEGWRHLPQQVVHNDFNHHNLVADAEGRLAGVLDFGDIVRTARVADIAVACSYLTAADDPLAAVAETVAACHALLPLTAPEIAAIPAMIEARHRMSLVITGIRAIRHPEQAGYITRNAPVARDGLARFAALPRVAEALMDACGVTP